MRHAAVTLNAGVQVDSQASQAHRLSRGRAFVGRENELRQLSSAFETAAAGHSILVMLGGEPGIGKTALCEQVADAVRARGGLALVGHCYEEGSFGLPYQPFVEALGCYLQACDAETVTAILGAGAADLARMLPMLRDRLHASPETSANPEEDRWRLLQAATDLLRNASLQRPLLLVLEDLHETDRGTLDLLLYLARSLRDTPLLVVGTYRDVEVDRAHPLSAALTELYRASNVVRLHLRGLSMHEVQRLLAETSQQRIPRPFAELVHRQTDGNPLFASQILRLAIEEGLMEKRDGALRRVGEEALIGRIPEGLRDAVGKRLSRLGDSANVLLCTASVIGREFQLDVLRKVLARSEEELEAALQEASAAALIEELSAVGTAVGYRFSHAFFRQALYEEIVAPRRIRLHQQVARALEDVHSARLEEHAAELAEHYAFSSDTSDLTKAVRYGELAARRAAEVFAYGEVARLLERALVVQDLADPGDTPRRCDLLLALGEALFHAGENERVIADIAPAALALAEALSDRSRAFSASHLAVDCLYARGAASGAARPEYLTWSERAREYANADSIDRVYANLALTEALGAQGRRQEAHALRVEALAIARRLDDREALFRSVLNILHYGAPGLWDERARLAEECAAWPRHGVSSQTLGQVLWYCGCLQLAQGERARAEELWRDMEELAERTHAVTISLSMAQRDATLAIVDGRLDDSVSLVKRFVERADEAGASVHGRQSGLFVLLAPTLCMGRAQEWLAAYDDYASRVSLSRRAPLFATFTAARAMCLAQLGDVDQARTLVHPVLDNFERTSDEELPIQLFAILLQAAVTFEHTGAARVLSHQLACVGHLSMGDYFYTCIARHMGDAAILIGDQTSARTYYVQALEAAGKIRFRPEIALAHLRLAELSPADGDDPATLQHLDLAIPELQDMQMQPALARAQAVRSSLRRHAVRARVRPAASDVLTEREREIADLVASGLTNRSIAEQLVISETTVEVHVKHILNKLGFRSRTQVARWFTDRRSDQVLDDRS
jgi:DNA-binding CsgD family transcriptional regulator